MTLTEPNQQGCSQQERLAPPLIKPDYLKLEERTFNQLLMEGVGFAELINFVTPANKIDGNWAKLLTHDESVIIALIERENNRQCLKKAHDRQYVAYSNESLKATLTRTRQYLELIRKIESWVQDLRRRNSAEAISVGVKLAEILEDQKYLIDQMGDEVASLSDDDLQLPLEVYKGLNPRYKEEPLRAEFAKQIEVGFENLQRALRSVGKFSQHLVESALTNGHHEPATALFLGFIQLLKKALNSSSHLIPQHREFYFQELLQIPKNGQKPDTTVLILKGNQAFIEKGTPFVSEKSETHGELIYTATSDLKLVPATIEALKTTTLHQDPFSLPGAHLGAVSSVVGGDPIKNPDHNLFGSPLSKHQRIRQTETPIGFAISHDILNLGQGKRIIRINLKLNRISQISESLTKSKKRNFRDFRNRCDLFWFKRFLLHLLLDFAFENKAAESELEHWAKQIKSYLSQSSDSEIQTSWKQAEEALNHLKDLMAAGHHTLCKQLFEKGFHFSVTTDAGWTKLNESEVTLVKEIEPDDTTHDLKILLKMPKSFPPVIGFDPALHQNDQSPRAYDTRSPVVEAVLNQGSMINNYSLLEMCLLEHVQIDVQVEGLKDLLVHNDLGQIDTSSTFFPFGPVPVVGSSLVIGSPEFSAKKLTKMSIDVQWADLPRQFGGFQSYYKAWGLETSNDSFVVESEVLNDGAWLKENNTQTMFHENDKKQVLTDRRFDIKDPSFFQPVPLVKTINKPLVYSGRSVGGFVRLQLTGPETAFGHKIQSQVLTKNVAEAARLKKTPNPINEPWTPKINSLSVNYSATTQISLRTQAISSLYTIYPFGLCHKGQSTDYRSSFLLPQFSGRASLCLGIKVQPNFDGGRLTLFFELDETSLYQRPQGDRVLRWAFLKDNHWNPIDEHAVVENETDGFLSSGIIAIDLPEGCYDGPDATATMSQMPDGLFWLQVSTWGDPAQFCKLKKVEVNALRVMGEMPEADDTFNKPPTIEPGSIQRPEQSVAGLEQVTQPLESRHGLQKESSQGWLRRCSERLRHRQRAVQPWDYERLVLQQFPEIDRVKCFPATRDNAPNAVSPGHVLLVVVSKLPEGFNKDDYSQIPPHVSAARLDEIRGFLLDRCSSRLQRHGDRRSRLVVRNPSYETVQIRCAVQFSDQASENRGMYHLNEAASRFVSPWFLEEGNDRFFNWELRPELLDAWLSELPYIEHITKMSLIKITQLKHQRFSKIDTAATQSSLMPHFPWSIPIPTKKHEFEVLGSDQEFSEQTAMVTGISALELGANFII